MAMGITGRTGATMGMVITAHTGDIIAIITVTITDAIITDVSVARDADGRPTSRELRSGEPSGSGKMLPGTSSFADICDPV